MEETMKLVTYDDDTITIRMNRKDEFLRLYKIVPAVVQEYEQLDDAIIGLTKTEVGEVSSALDEIMDKLHPNLDY
jgi:hypothetical protein